ncbi:MAG: hypothetical protein WCO56_22235 [Verrucomicrobiota bacterium]
MINGQNPHLPALNLFAHKFFCHDFGCFSAKVSRPGYGLRFSALVPKNLCQTVLPQFQNYTITLGVADDVSRRKQNNRRSVHDAVVPPRNRSLRLGSVWSIVEWVALVSKRNECQSK